MTIARNESLNAVRRRGRDRHTLPLPDAEFSDPSPSPDEYAAETADRDLLTTLIVMLDGGQRDVIALRAADFTTPEIAAVLGKREATVRKVQERALDRPCALLPDHLPENLHVR